MKDTPQEQQLTPEEAQERIEETRQAMEKAGSPQDGIDLTVGAMRTRLLGQVDTQGEAVS
jgi:hypothetical protein